MSCHYHGTSESYVKTAKVAGGNPWNAAISVTIGGGLLYMFVLVPEMLSMNRDPPLLLKPKKIALLLIFTALSPYCHFLVHPGGANWLLTLWRAGRTLSDTSGTAAEPSLAFRRKPAHCSPPRLSREPRLIPEESGFWIKRNQSNNRITMTIW